MESVNLFRTIALLLIGGLLSCQTPESSSGSTSGLLLTQEGVDFIQAHSDHLIVQSALSDLEASLSSVSLDEIEVPVPKDPGGGYTHEKHKANYTIAQQAGVHYQLTGEKASLDIAKELLLKYADMYPSLPLHPQQKNQGPGKLFWQILNEEVALVHFIQAYASVRDALSQQEQEHIEKDLITSMVTFIKDDSRRTFTKIHNHAMWGAAAVGMCGVVLENEEWIDQSVYGVEGDQTSGYFAMLDALFSPDGYYSEGPYYQRYALMPLVVLAQALELHQPSYNVFEYRDSIVLKAIQTTFDLSTCKGDFFPVNDAIKAKTIETPELGYALPLMFAYGGQDPVWMDAMQQNGNTMLTDALIGLPASGSAYERTSRFINDGPDGSVGGMGILRSSEGCDGITSVLKFGTHGMGHGHFDQLGLQVFIDGMPFLSDYGASRFHNIPQKEGGRYLRENNTWANQTVAHNAIVVDEQTQYDGNDKHADQGSSHVLYTQFDDAVQAVAGWDTTAYRGLRMSRHLATLLIAGKTLVVDIIQTESASPRKVDIPVYYNADLVEALPSINRFTNELRPLGKQAGYQHLWNMGASEYGTHSHMTWQKGAGFITLHQVSNENYQLQQVQTGANDPDNNLLFTPGIIARSTPTKSLTFVQLLERHGSYDPIVESTNGAYSELKNVSVSATEEYVTVAFDWDGEPYSVEVATSEMTNNERKIKIINQR